jgi:hypothetical protein
VRHNGLVDEFDYALRAGYDPDSGRSKSWFDLPRPTRCRIIATLRLKDLSAALSQIDSQDYWDAYAERRQRNKPKKGRK